jgi:hypothetical protein
MTCVLDLEQGQLWALHCVDDFRGLRILELGCSGNWS